MKDGMQAIVTKYIPPCRIKGARYRATSSAGSCSIAADHSMSYEANHRAAALKLKNRYGWKGDMIQGTLPDRRTVWVLFEEE